MKRSDYETLNQIGDKYSKLYSLQKSIDEKSLWDTDEETQMNAILQSSFRFIRRQVLQVHE